MVFDSAVKKDRVFIPNQFNIERAYQGRASSDSLVVLSITTVVNESSNNAMVVVWFFNQINNQIDNLQMRRLGL